MNINELKKNKMESKETNTTESQKEINRVNKTFNMQIDRDRSFYIDKQLFNLTLNFTLNDWKTMRTTEYWETTKKLSSKGQKEYLLICVKNYLDNLE
jgi:hypothetical protein